MSNLRRIYVKMNLRKGFMGKTRRDEWMKLIKKKFNSLSLFEGFPRKLLFPFITPKLFASDSLECKISQIYACTLILCKWKVSVYIEATLQQCRSSFALPLYPFCSIFILHFCVLATHLSDNYRRTFTLHLVLYSFYFQTGNKENSERYTNIKV